MATQLFTFSGDVNKPDFLHWICHRGNRLGLDGWVREDVSARTVEVLASGPEELLDAMELGCSLGPMTVWVEDIERCTCAAEPNIEKGFSILAVED
uniref:acylphosphatase n=1 Tax=Pararhizobium sp. IMCC3301 TaxID=3067904 RepID=UPI002740F75A|nr:acylphosphatase [Pararhizobium sp. IMCC3301]